MSSKEEELRRQYAEQPEPTVALNPLTGFQIEDLAKIAGKTALQGALQSQVFSKHIGAHTRKMWEIFTGNADYAPDKKDRRFQNEAWQKSGPYKQLLQSYLAFNETLEEWVDDLELDSTDKLRADFLLRIFRDSASPTNSLLSNPEALHKAWETKGESVVKGFNNLTDDLLNNHGIPAQVKAGSFTVGKNIATTQGAVVFKNELLELIQYTPSTKQVYERPLLLVTAMINKYYALDLTPDRSLIKFCVDSGFRMFTVSWANPRKEHADWGVEKYAMAVAEAVTAVRSITGSEDLNLITTCSGAMVTSALAAYLKAKGDASIHSMTVGVCMLEMLQTDMEMGAFATEETLDEVKKRSRDAGILYGHELALSMLWLRPEELIWGNVVNNYLLGNDPPAFDLLFWNNDWTNLPAQLHADVIDMFATGCLMHPGEMTMAGVPLDISALDCDKFFVGGISDHITPWQTCYRASHAYGGDKEFVLSNSGHIQTFLNSPQKKKVSYFTNKNLPQNAEDWLEGAELQEGSWWEYWRDWLSSRSGAKIPSPKALGNKSYPEGIAAPGSYVFQQSDEG